MFPLAPMLLPLHALPFAHSVRCGTGIPPSKKAVGFFALEPAKLGANEAETDAVVPVAREAAAPVRGTQVLG